jgi:ArsR family transcriptional regulator, arsenate/arsenite/antimonite-responsive transcriptional repressor
MKTEKNKRLEKRIPAIARKLKVCGHPIRLKLLCAIESKEPCVSDLSVCLSESQPVVSQHLAILKKEGIVASSVRGNRRIYSVTDPFTRDLVRSLHRIEADAD